MVGEVSDRRGALSQGIQMKKKKRRTYLSVVKSLRKGKKVGIKSLSKKEVQIS